MTNPNDNAFPVADPNQTGPPQPSGMTKRELIAALIFAARGGHQMQAKEAITAADILIKELNK